MMRTSARAGVLHVSSPQRRILQQATSFHSRINTNNRCFIFPSIHHQEYQLRCSHSDTIKKKHRDEVVTRFAPSPTGFMHLGALRTALYNYLLAKKKGGKFLLRIEDTDQKRLVEGSVEQIKSTLEWVGIKYDQFEVQSQRTAIYKEHAERLLHEGHAYKCYCKEERLSWLRDKGMKYDRHCLSLSPQEIAKLESEGASYTVRMKVPTSATEKLFTHVDDAIFGSMKFENSLIDDQILLKSDGHPTYHLANVVDDFEMKVSHVIRGVEWLSSTPKHVILYDMLFPNMERPVFAHLPLLVDETGAKLSKRKDHASVDWYRDQGILEAALINFVALLGWNKGQGSDKDIWSMDELIQEFSLEQVNKGNSSVNMQKLNWLNAQFTKRLVSENAAGAQKLAIKSLQAALPPNEASRVIDTMDVNFLQQVLELVAERLGNMQRFGELCWYFFSDFKFQDNTAQSVVDSKEAFGENFSTELQISVCSEFISKFEGIPDFSVDQVNQVLNDMKQQMKQHKINYKDLVTFIRLSCTGEKVGASIGQTLQLLGREKVLSRLNRTLEQLKKIN